MYDIESCFAGGVWPQVLQKDTENKIRKKRNSTQELILSNIFVNM